MQREGRVSGQRVIMTRSAFGVRGQGLSGLLLVQFRRAGSLSVSKAILHERSQGIAWPDRAMPKPNMGYVAFLGQSS